jgi:hypothetical protein
MSTVERRATIRGGTTAKAELVERLEDLGLEIESAMTAIAGDRLDAFEQSVRRQEIACNRLSALAGDLVPRLSDGLPSESEKDSALNLRLRAATAAIKALNAQYSALLRHSGHSLRLLASLSGVSTGYAGRSRPLLNQPRQQTWSCEG